MKQIISISFFVLMTLSIGVGQVHALAQYVPTGGILQTGTETAFTAGAASGNTGWKGTLNNDVYWWEVTSHATNGLDQEVIIDDVGENGANKIILTIVAKSGSTSLLRYYQICDWVNPNNVDVAADTNCTGGGWRTLNKTDGSSRLAISDTTERTFTFHIYDGYWTTGVTSNTSVATPVLNFIRQDGTKRVLIRAYSPSAVAAVHYFDLVSVQTVIDPIYMPAGFTQLSGGTPVGSYVATTNPSTLIAGTAGATGSDNVYLGVPGTTDPGGAASDFYLSFKNVKPLPSMNTVTFRIEYVCSASGLTVGPKIYNFATGSWESMATPFTCPTTDATHIFARNNIILANYIQNGEVRVGMVGDLHAATVIRIDMAYIIVGMTNNDNSSNGCKIDYGTGTDGNCTNTRDIDTSAGTNYWQPTTELDSTTFGHAYYSYDNDVDATANEPGVAVLATVPNALPNDISTVGYVYSYRLRSNSTTLTLQPQLKDESALNTANMGGFTNFGTTNASATFTYADSITNGYFGANTSDYSNRYNGTSLMRIRTTTSTSTGVSFVPDIDYLFLSVQYIQGGGLAPPLSVQYSPNGGSLVVGTEIAITSAATAGNTGSWRGTKGTSAYYWQVTSNASTGLDQELVFDGVRLNNANKLIVSLYSAAGSTSLLRYYQICDWVNQTAVDSAADSNCTGGGWRTLNLNSGSARAGIGQTTARTYTWHIYDGYWATSLTGNTPVSTPLTNFVRSDTQRILIRAYSPTALATTHYMNAVSVQAVIDPIYFPSGFENLSNGTVTGTYQLANNPPTLISGNNVTGSNNSYLQVAGTASTISDFMTTFDRVRTYEGANTILIAAETSCSNASGPAYKAKIYNFNSKAWVDLSTGTITCSTTDAVRYLSVNTTDMSDYVQNGRVLVGWYGSSNSTYAIRIDYIYIMIGTTNADTSQCEIDFGTGTQANCANTKTINTIDADSTFQVTTELESTSRATTFYPYDNDADAVNAEAAAAVNIDLPTYRPPKAIIVGHVNALRFRTNSTAMRAYPMMKDYSGLNTANSGGWTNILTYNAAATYSYMDSITNGYFNINPGDYITRARNERSIRFRTANDTATANVTWDIDFVFSSIQWAETTGSTSTSLEQMMRHRKWFDDYGIRHTFDL